METATFRPSFLTVGTARKRRLNQSKQSSTPRCGWPHPQTVGAGQVGAAQWIWQSRESCVRLPARARSRKAKEH